MASAIVANWDGIPDEIKLVIGAIEAAVGTALLAVGAILAFSGTNIGLGLALLIAVIVLFACANVLTRNDDK